VLSPSTQLGPYQILAPLGSGGMGEVYRALDSRLGREVAVKVLPSALAQDPERLARFEREARTVAALAHPNILVLHDVGNAEGVRYVVTELLQGQTLRQVLKQSPPSWRTAVEIVLDVAQGLAAAHAKGIVHRDLKPDNIFITTDGRTKILDFGLARRENDGSFASETFSTPPAVTAAGMVMGTVGYMAPEQVRGQVVDARGDVFALGCVLYEMVSGQRPFARPTPAATLAAILAEDPPDLAATGQALPRELVRVIRRCLEKRPEARFQSGGELAPALRGLRAELRPGHSHPVAAMVVVTGLLLGAAFLLEPLRHGRRSGGPTVSASARPAIESIAVMPLLDRSGDPTLAHLGTGVPRTIIRTLLEIPDLTVRPFSSVAAYATAEAVDPGRIGRQLDVEAVMVGSITQGEPSPTITVELVDVRNNRSLWLQSYDPGRDLLAMQDDILRELTAKLGWRLSAGQRERLARRPTEDTAAYLMYLEGLHLVHQFTVADIQQGIDRLERAVARDPGFALAHAALADAYIAAAYIFMQPGAAFEKARQAAAQALRLDPQLAQAQAALATVKFHVDWDWAGADHDFQEALRLDPRCAFAYDYYGWYWVARGEGDKAVAALEKAVELEPRSVLYNADLAFVYQHAHRFDAAEQQAHRTLELDPNAAMAPWVLSLVFAHRDRNYAASLEQAQTFLERDRQRPDAYAMLAWIHGMSGRPEEARQALAELERLSRHSHVRGEAWAWAYTGIGDKDRAFHHLNQACDERSPGIVFFKLDPLLDRLRDDPRFDRLLRRIGVASGRPS
jgi:serine/threonine protein kinase/tetratricopeptide (TPR) repeat protein